MTLGRYATVAALVASIVTAFGCSKKDSSTQTASGETARELTDSELIQNTLNEVVTRWH
ncbi:MAG: hypothetical protein HY851_07550 [candidate division Zixibacteria bacterium]|nr:hypothetical protein [candidate division Zixibacteria bacterium]